MTTENEGTGGARGPHEGRQFDDFRVSREREMGIHYTRLLFEKKESRGRVFGQK